MMLDLIVTSYAASSIPVPGEKELAARVRVAMADLSHIPTEQLPNAFKEARRESGTMPALAGTVAKVWDRRTSGPLLRVDVPTWEESQRRERARQRLMLEDTESRPPEEGDPRLEEFRRAWREAVR